jgi:predicted amidohydrolase YtcJ
MRYLLTITTLCLLWACQSGGEQSANSADVIFQNGNIYTVDSNTPKAEAVAVKDGKITFVGSNAEVENYRGSNTQVVDLGGKTMVPGLIESHGHIMGLGRSKRTLNLMGVKNYDEMVDMVAEAAKNAEPGEWITGRGWHQSKWTPQPEVMITGYQTHEKLSAVSPDNPVYLKHASGHAAIANAKAMEIAGITNGMEFADDGEVIKYPDGRPTGVFSERAAGLIEKHMPADDKESRRKDLQAAIDECLANGLTSFQDAGSGALDIEVYQEFIDQGKLDLRLWIMLSGGSQELLEDWYQKGPRIDDQLTIRAIKLYADGALGSRGAWLIEEYTDRPGHFGNPIMPMSVVYGVSEAALKHGFQVCVHAIGDRANKEVLDQFERAFEGNPDAAENSRFRVEHAQHLHLEDIPRFAELGVIASMQAIHMSSDRPWAIDRLGQQRIEDGAYVWQKLLQSGAKVINGTDAPVEPVSPIASFYASVTRQTLAGTPKGGYEPSQKMTREQALKSYTLDAAYGGFQEDSKGSIEVGKLADFTVLSQDMMTVPDNEILNTGIVYTIVGGDIKYSGEK